MMLQPWTLRLILNDAVWQPEVRLCSSGLMMMVECRPCVCVYYCRTYYKAVCAGGGGASEGHVL
jgi:hypothetical protein